MRVLAYSPRSKSASIMRGLLGDIPGTLCWGTPGPVGTLNHKAGSIPKDNWLARAKTAGIPVPLIGSGKFAFSPGTRLLSRKIHHHGGTDIKIVINLANAPAGRYYVQRLNITDEWRVFVARDRILGTYLKILQPGVTPRRPWRNRANGWDFSFRNRESHPGEIRELAKKALIVPGSELDFGAVDVCLADGQYYVLEVNSAPGITDPNRTWVVGLVNWIREMVDR